MTLDLILTNITIWLVAVAGLFVAIGGAMEESVKPFLHAILDSIPEKRIADEQKEEILKPFLVRTSALLIGYVIALPLQEVYNFPIAWYGRYANPVWGVLPAVFLAVFLGRQIHDRWGKKDETTPTIPA